MLFAENNIQIAINENLTHIAQGELWQDLGTWHAEGKGISVATVIGRLCMPRTRWFDPQTYRPRSKMFSPRTATIHKLFGLGVRHYLKQNGITDENARIETDLRAENYGPAHRRSWHVDYPDAKDLVLRFTMTRPGRVGPINLAIGEFGENELDGASNFIHPERIGTEGLEKLVPEPGDIVMFLGNLTLNEEPKGQGWREVHDATVWLNSRPPSLAC